MLHGRLEWLAPGDLDEEQRALYGRILGGPRSSTPRTVEMTDDAGRLHGPFNAMLIDPVVGEAAQQLGAAVRYGTQLGDRAREIAILEVAAVHESNFEFYAHRKIGVAAGLSEEEVDAIARRESVPSFRADEQLVREVVNSLAVDHDLDDRLYARAISELGTVVISDLVVLVGFYEYTALALRVFRVPLPPFAPPTFTRVGRPMPG